MAVCSGRLWPILGPSQAKFVDMHNSYGFLRRMLNFRRAKADNSFLTAGGLVPPLRFIPEVRALGDRVITTLIVLAFHQNNNETRFRPRRRYLLGCCHRRHQQQQLPWQRQIELLSSTVRL
jgi:hypothetical protein